MFCVSWGFFHAFLAMALTICIQAIQYYILPLACHMAGWRVHSVLPEHLRDSVCLFLWVHQLGVPFLVLVMQGFSDWLCVWVVLHFVHFSNWYGHCPHFPFLHALHLYACLMFVTSIPQLLLSWPGWSYACRILMCACVVFPMMSVPRTVASASLVCSISAGLSEIHPKHVFVCRVLVCSFHELLDLLCRCRASISC